MSPHAFPVANVVAGNVMSGANGLNLQAAFQETMQMQRNTPDAAHTGQPFRSEQDLAHQNVLRIAAKLLPPSLSDGLKKKRGRPKKLILDPSTNQYIDSSHENFKKLNKILKQAMESADAKDSGYAKSTKLDIMNDQALKQLLELKDRRGRPRKFPIEQTGLTIKGIRVNGTMKGRKKVTLVLDPNNVHKKKRGRPKREVEVELSSSA